MSGRNKQGCVGRNNEVASDLFTPPSNSIANQSIELSTIQKNILKEIKNSGSRFTIKGCAEALKCDPKNIRYHLKKLKIMNLVTGGDNFEKWNLTNMGLQLFSRGGINKVVLGGNNEVVQVAKKSCVFPEDNKKLSDLTDVEKKILQLTFGDNKKPKTIAKERKTSEEAVRKVLRKLKKEGIIREYLQSKQGGNKEVVFLEGSPQPLPPHYIRLHAMQYAIDILTKFNGFKGTEEFYFEDNFVKVWENSIEIYSQEGLSFTGIDPQSATNKAIKYWNGYFKRLESHLDIELLRDGVSNFHLVKCEYAEVSNEIATEMNLNQDKLRIYTNEGKLWALVDNSFDMNEFETVKSDSAKQDMEKVRTVFNDIRDNGSRVFLPSEITNVLGNISNTMNYFQQETAKLQNQIYELGASQKTSIEMFNNLLQTMTPASSSGKNKGGEKESFTVGSNSMFM